MVVVYDLPFIPSFFLYAGCRSSLVPVFAFGENDLFNQVSNPPGSWLRNMQDRIQKKIAFAPVFFYGRGIFQYTFGLLPHRRPVNVVGKQSVPISFHPFWLQPKFIRPWNLEISDQITGVQTYGSCEILTNSAPVPPCKYAHSSMPYLVPTHFNNFLEDGTLGPLTKFPSQRCHMFLPSRGRVRIRTFIYVRCCSIQFSGDAPTISWVRSKVWVEAGLGQGWLQERGGWIRPQKPGLIHCSLPSRRSYRRGQS